MTRSPFISPSRASGFTLLEMMIVLAIIGVITAMAATSAQQIGARNATQSAASDLSSVLQNARARAEQRGGDVYVMVYTRYRKSPAALTGGNGAIFIFEDMNGNFLTGAGACDGTGTAAAADDCSWANFNPVANQFKGPAAGADRLVDIIYFDDYAKKNVRFGKPAGAFGAPFAGIGTLADADGCSFCQNNKGAVVFTGEQQLRFLRDTGAPMAQRVAGLGLQSVDNNGSNSFLFGLVGSTGLVTLVK